MRVPSFLTRFCSLALALALVLATPASAQNVLVNPGFETGNFTGWQPNTYQGALTIASSPTHSGNYSARSFNSGINISITGLRQTFAPVNTADVAEVSFWLYGCRYDGPFGQCLPLWAGLRLEYADGSANVVSLPTGAFWKHVDATSALLPGKLLTAISAEASLPPGYFLMQQTLYYDDFVVAVTPSCGPVGSHYCNPAVVNSTGASAAIFACGSTSAASNDLMLTAADLPPNQSGYFLASQAQATPPFMPAGSAGFICLSGSIGRFNQPGLVGQGPSFSIQMDLTSIPVNPPAPVLPGDTWNFQCWYRDVGSTNNFTDAVSVTFN